MIRQNRFNTVWILQQDWIFTFTRRKQAREREREKDTQIIMKWLETQQTQNNDKTKHDRYTVKIKSRELSDNKRMIGVRFETKAVI